MTASSATALLLATFLLGLLLGMGLIWEVVRKR